MLGVIVTALESFVSGSRQITKPHTPIPLVGKKGRPNNFFCREKPLKGFQGESRGVNESLGR